MYFKLQVPNPFVEKFRKVHGSVVLPDAESAREFVYALSNDERERLLSELHKFDALSSSGKSNLSKLCSISLTVKTVRLSVFRLNSQKAPTL